MRILLLTSDFFKPAIFLKALLYKGQNIIRDLEFINTYEAEATAILKDSFLDVRAKLDNGSIVN
ncbi:hypothetical protein ACP6PL_15455 [Dapis sp. BLCC M126]|uniref:hypothetical protein n=1 Tax=Dapis sp. BLCC M126 TaxID=3400189 RepID=UPI003CE9DE81